MVNFMQMTKSRLRQKILAYFYTNTEAQVYLREAASILKEDPGNLSKELAKLEKEGIFISSIRGRQKYISLNKEYPLYGELKSIIFKTVGLEGALKKTLERIVGIEIAFIYGSFADNRESASSDIDLFIVGSPDEDALMAKIETIEKPLQREINYNVYPPSEFHEKLKKKDAFLENILKRPRIMLKGRLNGI